MDIYTIRAINTAQKEIKQIVNRPVYSTIRHGKVIISDSDTHSVYFSARANKESINEQLFNFIIEAL